MALHSESLLYILGVETFRPEERITNAFLESLDIGTDDAWIMERVGIRERRTVLNLDYIRSERNCDPSKATAASLHTNAEMAQFAARPLLERVGINPNEVGLLISGGCCPQQVTPTEACVMSAAIGVQTPSIDVNSACSSFVAALHFLGSMRAECLPKYILVINSENMTRTVDYRDRNTAVLWGDATTATLLTADPVIAKKQRRNLLWVKHTEIDSDPTGWDKVQIPLRGHFMQNGPQVQNFAVRKTLATFESLRSKSRSSHSLRFIGHQANLNMLRSVCERAGITDDRHFYNVDRFGNTGAAGIPSVLSESWNRLRPGDEVALIAVGSGLTWGGVLVEVINAGEIA